MSRSPRMVLIEPNGVRREVVVQPLPFKLGRQAGNELTLRDSRISREQAQIIAENGKYILEDLGSRHGTFVNGQKVVRHELRLNDSIEFGVPDSYRLIYMGEEASLDELLQRVEPSRAAQYTSRELYHLGVLLDVARTLQTSMSQEDVLAAVLDAAIQVTHTERGVLLLPNAKGELEPAVARDARRGTLNPQALEISQSVLKQAARSRRELIVSDIADDKGMQQQASVVRLQLHTIVAIPLEKLPMVGSLDTTMAGKQAELLGVLYLDSHAPGSAFSELDRAVLRSLSMEAATVIENARLFAAVRAKEQLELQMKIAQDIQQRLLPKNFPQLKHTEVTGLNIACEMVGGDYFDVIELAGDRQGIVVADVSGKGIPAALLASMLQGVFSATAGMDISLRVMASRVNKYLCERSSNDRYATLFYGVLDSAGELEYINAGHVPPMVRTTLGQIYTLAADNFPLGMFDFAEYRTGRAALQPGDFLVIYTDGVSEARNMRDELFGEFGLREVMKEFQGGTVEQLAQAIQAGVSDFTGGAPQADDITLVIVHYKGQGG